MQLTRQEAGTESQVLIPITYHMKNGLIQTPEKTTSTQVAVTVNAILKRSLQCVTNPADVSLYQVIRDLLLYLEL